MGGDSIFGKMVRDMKGSGRKESFMEKESRLSLMGQSLMATGLREDPMELGCASIPMEPSTQEPGRTASLMDKE